MKQPMNFRLSNKATTTLSILEKKMHTSKTEIIEEALRLYAKKALSKHNLLLNYAGILNDKDADEMLKAVQTSKHSKDIEIDL